MPFLRPISMAMTRPFGLLLLVPLTASAVTPGDPGPAAVRFTVSSSQNVRAISPLIYGDNHQSDPARGVPFGMRRLGGNRWTGYNWENNFSNAGSDYFHYNDNYLVNFQNNTPPGEAIRPSLVAGANAGSAVSVTVPIAGYVSADGAQEVFANQQAPSSRWRELRAKKSSVYSGAAAALSLNPNKTDNYVFTDELVHWVESRRGSAPVLYELDNEPGLWNDTHPRIVGTANPTFEFVKNQMLTHAAAVKDVAPNSIVLSTPGFGWSDFSDLHGAPDIAQQVPGPRSSADMHWHRYLLDQIQTAETAQGRTLVDALSMHWYSEARGGGVRITERDNSAAVVAARVQAPRSLWDPTYTETSWISQWATQGPIRLLDRVQDDIDARNPGMKIAMTEYNFGGGDHISGAIAQADVLGIFGREGIYAANHWNLEGAGSDGFTLGAFEMFLNYDGLGNQFGDTSVSAATNNIAASAVYASIDSTDPTRMVLVAINRTASSQTTAIQVTSDRVFSTAEVYRLTAASVEPVRGADVPLTVTNAMLYTMPAYSVTTLVLTGGVLPGDYNADGLVDAADYTVWRDNQGATVPAGTLGDGDRNGVVTQADYDLWSANYGRTLAATTTAVPEPKALAAALVAVLGVTRRALRGLAPTGSGFRR
jgi:hypothetical protein